MSMIEQVNFKYKKPVLLGIIFTLSSIIFFIVLSTFIKSTLKEMAVTHVLNLPHLGDAQETAATLHRFFCRAFESSSCRILLTQGSTILAQIPTAYTPAKSSFVSTTIEFAISQYTLPVKASIEVVNLWTFIGFPLALSSTVSGLFTLLITLLLLQKDKLQMEKKIQEQRELHVRDQALAQMAAQISHDIRSPLSAINLILNDLFHLPEEKRLLIRHSVKRIHDIAHSLLNKSHQIQGAHQAEEEDVLLKHLLDLIISEKRVQYQNYKGLTLDISYKKIHNVFIKINPSEFKRVISNLINNSCESLLDFKGHVTIEVHLQKNSVVILIKDTGRGMPKHIINNLGSPGLTYGKEISQKSYDPSSRADSSSSSHSHSGSGLGIPHALKIIHQFKGQILFDSTLHKGTTVKIILPTVTIPEWYAQHINISHHSTLVILDDDTSIHMVWKTRWLSNLKNKIKIEFFSSPLDFKKWHHKSKDKNNIYLIDLEFMNFEENGIQLMESLQIQNTSYLVTSHHDERLIQEKCKSERIKIIPKFLVQDIPLIIT